MNDDELKRLWQEQPLSEPTVSAAQLVSAMQNKMTGFRRLLDARDLRELLGCVLVILIFGYYSFNERTPVVRLGWLIVIGGSIYSGWKLAHARRTTRPAPPGATVVESLRAELKSVRTQSRLLGSVLWWYLLPPIIGLLVATWGMKINLHAKIPATLIYLAGYAFVYWLNRRELSKELVPLEAQLQSLLHSAETGEPLDEAHVATLRPTVLAMASAGHVQPIEFKVAFWQVALYGEIAFVGFWFFGNLSRTNFDLSFMVEPRPLAWLVGFFLAGLLFSRLVQKITERAVGISPLGIHLVLGQILIPWDEIKEVRVLRVLNIRSLWLIRESGEKVIMPWSSLERHSDLKTAVEDSAPANHPIRKYLSLLTRT
jgi:hypothetical protein